MRTTPSRANVAWSACTAALLAAALGGAGCKRDAGATTSTGIPTDAPARADAGALASTSSQGAPQGQGEPGAPDAASPPPEAREPADHERDASADGGSLMLRGPTRGRSIGHTSVVFALEAEDGAKAAFKPASRRGPSRYKGEIAAYRLALALGLPNVPPALPRSFPRDELRAALGASTKAGELLAAEALERDGRIPGALIPWVDALAFLPLEAAPLRDDVRRWLTRGSDIPSAPVTVAGSRTITFDPSSVAAETSAMAIFDALTGNWDRWSGANVGFDRERGMLLFVDNDGAFLENPPKKALAANLAHLRRIDRFSRALVERLRALDDEALTRAIGEETPGAPLLSERALAGVRARRDEAKAIVAAKIAEQGERETLFFP